MSTYTYITPENTYTIDKFIACQNTEEPSYYNFSFKDEYFYNYINRYLRYTTYNAIWDYLDDIRDEYCMYNIVLSDSELAKYKYRPKLLAFDLYECAELGYLILLLNDMYSCKQFTKNRLTLPTKAGMKLISQYLFNANQAAINAYNN